MSTAVDSIRNCPQSTSVEGKPRLAGQISHEETSSPSRWYDSSSSLLGRFQREKHAII